MKLKEDEVLYVLLEYLPKRKKKEEKIWKAVSSRKAKLKSWHSLTVHCLMNDDGYLKESGNTYVTTQEGHDQILPLWNGKELQGYHVEPTACRLLKGIGRMLKSLLLRWLQM